jgi:hypothetical protein
LRLRSVRRRVCYVCCSQLGSLFTGGHHFLQVVHKEIFQVSSITNVFLIDVAEEFITHDLQSLVILVQFVNLDGMSVTAEGRETISEALDLLNQILFTAIQTINDAVLERLLWFHFDALVQSSHRVLAQFCLQAGHEWRSQPA